MRTKAKNLARVEQDRLLNESLKQTFSASDPIALQQISIIGRENKTVPAGKHADKKTDRHKISHRAEPNVGHAKRVRRSSREA
jgi:hypothetical protein